MSETLMTRIPRSELGPEMAARLGHAQPAHRLGDVRRGICAGAHDARLRNEPVLHAESFSVVKSASATNSWHACSFRCCMAAAPATNRTSRARSSAGFTQSQIDALIAGEDQPFTTAERAVIGFARQVALTNMDGEMTPKLFAALRGAFL